MLKAADGNFQVDGSSRRMAFPVIVCILWDDLDDEEEGEKGKVVMVVVSWLLAVT